ncbi:MAG TPA: hypothetical protein VMH61_01485, partial [Candidatus Acidoferrales bacterium]|nr:hypothetical protein [Candidatus Acidoferrales bacterium]
MRHPLRTLLLAALLAMLPIARTSGAGTLGVDPTSRIIVSSRLYVAFDPYYPEVIRTMVFKDWDPNTDLSTDGSSNSEFWGQTYRNGSDPGYIVPYETVLGTWQVAQQDSHSAQIVITSQSLNQPVIVTTYRFYADQPYFLVDRSIQFAGAPDTSAYQAYLARFAFNDIYHALRWRTPSGTLIQRGFCIEPCVENDWDGRWLQQVQMSGRT